MRIADLWLDEVTEFPATGGPVLALSAAQWIEHTWDQWQVITTPIAESTTKAMTGMMAQQAMEHPGLSQALDEVTPMFRSLIGALFGIQIGQAIGTVSRDVFGLSDIGLALGPPKAMAQLPSTIKKFATDLDLPDAEVRLFLAIREAAHARLFSSVPWLKDNLFASVEAYAAGISIDLERMETQMRQLDLSDAETVRHALSSGVFAPAVSPAQKAALTRLETALALVEGWVDVVASAAGQNRLPSLAALRELVRRRRAVGGPAEQTFAGLVGLELRPRQAREAAKLWAGVTDQLGQAGREAIWAHPDIMPTTEDLAEPDSYLERRAERQAKDAAVDAEIQAFFEAQED
jgi:putative hydrolase